MGAIIKFFALGAQKSIFKFTVDTTKINSGATNGSQNPLTYKIPIVSSTGNATNFILKVNDGRPDTTVIDSDIPTKSILTFATPGIYEITIIGRVGLYRAVNATFGYDYRKLISIDNWGNQVRYQSACFDGCLNLVIRATNPLTLPSECSAFFRNIAGFSEGRLDNIIMTNVTVATSILSGVATNLTSLLNAFMPNLISANQLYAGLNVSSVAKMEIISNSVTNCSNLIGAPTRSFTGELILQTPNNTNIQALCYYMNVMPSLAKVDITNVVTTLNFLRTAMTTARVDATLLGWANDYDWTSIPTITNKATFNFVNSKYSNNVSVIAAKSFLESKGYVFTNLTMA